jgi:serpin B
MNVRGIMLLILSGMLVLSCLGCIDNTTTDNQSAISEEPADDNESIDIDNPPVDLQSTINAESVDDYDIACANNAFAFKLYSRVKNGEEENVFFSPYSIFTAMAICYDGAEDSTREQISDVFYFPLNKTALEVRSREMTGTINSETEDYELETANALWISEDYPIREHFISNSENYYSGNVTELDFANRPEDSRNTINDRVEEKTNDRIKDLIPAGIIKETTRLVITNAIYFNGKWLEEFDKGNTREKPFYPSADEEISVDMMYKFFRYNYGENSNAKILELPYRGKNMSMFIVLPDDNDIENFENSFSISDYEELKSDMDNEYNVKTSIPKFKFETRTELSGTLKEMGMEDAFDQEYANFSGIYDGDKITKPYEKKLHISSVIHQAFVDAQEEGTEAAAATAVVMPAPGSAAPGSDPEPIREFKADHPFLFFIEDTRTNCILFMGKIEAPEYG